MEHIRIHDQDDVVNKGIRELIVTELGEDYAELLDGVDEPVDIVGKICEILYERGKDPNEILKKHGVIQ